MRVISTSLAIILGVFGLFMSVSAIGIVAIFPWLKRKMPKPQQRPSSAFHLGQAKSKSHRRHTCHKCRVRFSDKDVPCMPSRRKSLFANIRSRKLPGANLRSVFPRSLTLGGLNTNAEGIEGRRERSPFMKGRARFADAVSPVWQYPANVLPNIKRRMSRPNQNWDDNNDEEMELPELCSKPPSSECFTPDQKGVASIHPPASSATMRRGKSLKFKVPQMRKLYRSKSILKS